jgi:uncharacterized membrane protein
MFGYDSARLHAAVNDAAPVLLPMSVVFDLLGAFLKRESLKAAGFWTLSFGVVGGGLAIVTGLLADEATPHGAQAEAVMSTHETLAYIVVGLFAVLAVWRLLRRGVWNEQEQPIALTAGVIGIVLVVVQASFGGKLVFEHGVGIPTPAIQSALQDRAAAAAEGHEHGAPAAAPAATPGAGPATQPSAAAAPAALPDSAKR